ncbi:MAG: hypothetical protein ACLFNR_02165 [Candidatus Paceibacterota bacterium]
MATKKKDQNKKSNTKSYLAWGAGIGAVVAGAAGAYFLYGTKEGAKRRKQMKSWAVKMKGDVMKRLEDLKEVNQQTYNKIIDEVAAKYEKMRSVEPQELAALVTDMKRYWKHVEKEVKDGDKKKTTQKKTPAKKTASTAKKTTATKKTGKNTKKSS